MGLLSSVFTVRCANCGTLWRYGVHEHVFHTLYCVACGEVSESPMSGMTKQEAADMQYDGELECWFLNDTDDSE